jgi:hypothetical protein
MSAADAVCSVGLVEDGNVVVGSPGAPGCTTTGAFGSACCAFTESDNKHASVAAANGLREIATEITDMEGLTLSQSVFSLTGSGG